MFCPNCGTKLEEDANFCTNCGYKIGSPMTEEQPKANTTANSAPDAQTNANAQANANANVQFQNTSPKRDPNKPLIDNEKLPEGIRNMPAQKFNSLAIWSAVVGLVLGLISLVFLIPINTGYLDHVPLIMGTQGGSIAIYIVFLILFIAGLIMTVVTEILGGIHLARKADYKGLIAVLISNFVEFIMMFFMIPTLNFFSKVSSLIMRGSDVDDFWELLGYGADAYSSYSSAPSIAAGIVMIVISIAVIVVIARFTAPDPVKESAEPADF